MIVGDVTSIKNPRSWDVVINGHVGEWIEDRFKALGDRRLGFDFDEPICRANTDCVKWDVTGEGAWKEDSRLPLWVADMDFRVASRF